MKKLIKKILKEEFDDFNWVNDVKDHQFDSDDEHHKFLAFVDKFGMEEVYGDPTDETEFKKIPYSYFELDIFEFNNGEQWIIGTESEFDDALYQYWGNYIDDIGSGAYGYSNYLTISDYDRESFANEMADNYVDDLGDDEIIERSDYESEFNDLVEEEEELLSEKHDLDIEDDENDGVRIDEIDDRLTDIEREKVRLLESARDYLHRSEYNDWYDCLHDPVNCLIKEHGWYSSVEDLMSLNMIQFDREEWIRDQINEGGYGDLSPYGSDYYEMGDYIMTRYE